MIVLSVYNDAVTPNMKRNLLYCFIVCCTPNTRLENYGTPLGVHCTIHRVEKQRV